MFAVQAQTITKQATGTDLNAGASWVDGNVPGAANVATWVSTSLGPGLTLGSSLAWQGINVSGATGDVALTAAVDTSRLTIGSSGITLTGTRNLTLNPSLGFNSNQTWSIAGGRSLVLIGASRNANGTGNIDVIQTGTGVANVRMSMNGNNANWNNFSGNITVNSNVKVQSEGNASAAFGTGNIILNGGQIAQNNGSWTWSNNIDVSAASVIGNDSSSGVGRLMKLTGNLTSSNSSGLTFTNNITGGTRTDDVGFILAGAGASTYTTTTISGNSRLRVGGNAENTIATTGTNSGNRGSLGTGNVTLSATTSELAFTRSDAHTVANNISGSGTVVIGGNTTAMAGTNTQVVTLSGTSSYTGTTRVSRSRLNLTGSLTSAVNLDNAATISGTGSTTGLLTLASGSNIVLPGGGTTTSLTSNGVTFSGSSAIVFLTSPVESTVYDVLTYGSGTVINPGNLTSPYRGTLINDVANQKFTFTAGAYGATRTWNTTSGTWAVSSGTNFNEGDQMFYGGDNVIFGNIASDSTITLSGIILPGSVSVNHAANSYTFAGTAIAGTASVSKSGTGSLVLSVANTYSGGTTISGGTLRLGNAGALGTAAVTVNNTGTLDVSGFAATNTINLSGTGNGVNPALWNSASTFTSLGSSITLAGNASVGNSTTDRSTLLNLGNTNLAGNTLTIAAGAVGINIRNFSSGNIVIASGGTLYSENGTNTYTAPTGTITINSGGRMETRDTDNTAQTSAHTIALNGGTLATATLANNNGGGGGTTLRNNISVDATNGGIINGSNTAFAQNLRLTGAITGSGALTITGTQGVELRGDTSGYSGNVTVNGGTLTLNPTANTSFGGVIAGNRPIVKSGSNTMTFTRNNTFSGTTTISAGTLQIGNGDTTGSLGTGAVINNASLVFNRSNDLSASNNITGTGSLTKEGAGTLTLTGTNGYAGSTMLNAGVLHFNSSANQTLAGAISGSGGLQKSGSGTLTLNGTLSAFSGNAMVSGGGLLLNGTMAGNVSVDSGATLGGTGGSTGSLNMAANSNLLLPGGLTTSAMSFNGVTFANKVTLNFTNFPTETSVYDVMSYGPGGLTGFSNLVAAARGTLTNDTVNSKITFTVGGSGIRTWDTGDGVWNSLGQLQNWAESDKVFFQGDEVVFGNIAANTTITLEGQLTPFSAKVENSANTYTFAGTGGLSGGFLFDKLGAGTLQIANPNPGMTGSSLVDSGTLRFVDGGTWGSGGFLLQNGGTMEINQATNLTLAGAISGGGSLSKSGTGTLTLGGNNGFSGGITLSGGLIRLENNGALGTGAVTVNSGTLGRNAARTILNNFGVTGSLSLGGTGQDTGNLTLSGSISGDGTLTNVSGITLLSGTNSFSGSIVIQGTAAQGWDVVMNNAGSENGEPDLHMTGGRFILAAPFVGTVATIGNLTGTAGIINPQFAADTGIRTLQVNQTSNGTFAGNIQDGGGNRFVGLTKTGAATLTLSGTNNTYTGPTTINAGTLALGVSNALAATPVTIGNASLALNGGVSDTVGTLDVTAAATINLGTGATLAFANSSAIDWAGGTLAISGNFVSGSSLRFGTDQTGLTSTQLGQIAIAGLSNFALDANGYLTASSADPFDDWASENGLDGTPGKEAGFAADPDGDGIPNGLEWILGGVPLDGKSGSLITSTATASGGLTLTFTRNEESIGKATLSVEYNSDLGAVWNTVTIGATSSSEANGVEITVNPTPSPDVITVNIPASNATNGKIFGRLKAVKP